MAKNEKTGIHVPPGSDIQPGAARVSLPVPPPQLTEDYTPEGDYIPLSGGTQGWFRNNGVMDVEGPNNYRFHEAVDEEAFRLRAIEGIKAENRRSAKRSPAALPVRVRYENGRDEEPAFCLDLSISGARLRTRRRVSPDEPLYLTITTARQGNADPEDLVAMAAKVRWCEVATTRGSTVRYLCGVQFEPLDLPAQKALAALLD